MSIESADIEDQAKAPQRTTTDEGSVTERPIEDLIKADVYNRSAGITSVPFGLRAAKIKFSGTT